MESLQRVLASGVLEALELREHVLVAEGSGDALLDEVEGIIAPSLSNIVPHLSPELGVMGEVTTTFGDDEADEAVETVVHDIAEQLMESDHVDDIFAEDRLIRRDAFRAIRTILLAYVEGAIEVSDEDEAEGTVVDLTSLGYIVATVARRAEGSEVEEALLRAAGGAGATLLGFDAETGRATFTFEEGSAGLLLLEETIHEECIEMVDSERVDLPNVEQILQVDDDTASHPGYGEALRSASTEVQTATGCVAACAQVDSTTLLASLTPLSDEDAARAEEHFGTFLEILERKLGELHG